MEISKGFKKTEVGIIPEDWTVHTLRDDINSLDAGVSVNSIAGDVFPGDYTILKTSAISKGKFNPFESKLIVSKDLVRAKLNPKANSLIISRMNTPELVGECCYVEKDYSTIFLPDRLWQTTLFKNSNLNCRWLNYILNTDKYRKIIKEAATGTSNTMKNISKDQILSIMVPYPDPKEQNEIATVLSHIDDLTSSLTKLIEKKKNIKQGAMRTLLNGPIIQEGSTEEWITIELGKLCRISKGKQLNRSTLTDSGTYYALNGGVSPSGFTEEWNRSENTISISEGGESCGYVNFNFEKFWCGGHCYTIEDISENVDKNFLYQLLKFNEKSIMALRIGSGLPNIQKKSLIDYIISAPRKLEVQIEIANILSDMDFEIKILEQKLNKYKMIKQGMMQELLTGRIRLF